MRKIYFEDTLIGTDYYGGLVKSAEVFNQTFKLGATICEEYKFTVDKSQISNKEPSVVYLYNDDILEKTLYVDDYKEDDFTITYDLVDSMVNFNFGYDASAIASGDGTTLLEIFQDICSKANVTTDIVSFDFDDMIITWYDNSITARDYLSFIGEINASYLYITADNKLAMKSVNSPAVANYNFDEIGKYKIGQKHKFSRVVLNNGINFFEAGDETGDTYYINVSNVYVTGQDVVDNIYNKIKDYEFYDVEIDNLPTFDLTSAGDNITITDENNNVYNTIMRYDNLNLSGNIWYGGLKNTLDTSKQEETEVIDTKESIRRLKITIDRDNNIIRQEVSQTINDTKNELSNTINENYETLSGQINEMTTDEEFEAYKTTIASELSATEARISQVEEITANGVTTVKTTSGTFDNNGLTMEQTGAKTKGIFNQDGVDIQDAQGSSDEDLLFAGYVTDEKATANEDLTPYKGQTVVYTRNNVVKNYLVIGKYSRIEDYEDGTGIFYIGG